MSRDDSEAVLSPDLPDITRADLTLHPELSTQPRAGLSHSSLLCSLPWLVSLLLQKLIMLSLFILFVFFSHCWIGDLKNLPVLRDRCHCLFSEAPEALLVCWSKRFNQERMLQLGRTGITQPHWAPLFLHPSQRSMSFLFRMMVILTGLACNLKVVSMCISLMTNVVQLEFPAQ